MRRRPHRAYSEDFEARPGGDGIANAAELVLGNTQLIRCSEGSHPPPAVTKLRWQGFQRVPVSEATPFWYGWVLPFMVVAMVPDATCALGDLRTYFPRDR